jgi:hypothetical protein
MTVAAVSVMSRMLSMTYSLHNSVEPTVGTSVVLNDASGTISFLQSVATFHVLTISVLELRLLITSVRVVHSVLELVVRWALQELLRKQMKTLARY